MTAESPLPMWGCICVYMYEQVSDLHISILVVEGITHLRMCGHCYCFCYCPMNAVPESSLPTFVLFRALELPQMLLVSILKVF
jgi:hypothetical protein